MGSPPLTKTNKPIFGTQIVLRIFAIAATLAAGWLMVTSKETSNVYGLTTYASYSYSPAFKFFVVANFIAFGLSVVSLFITFFMGRSSVDPIYYFYIFMHDLAISIVLIAGCAAATAIGFVGKYGMDKSGWVAICGYFAKFCNRVQNAAVFSYLGFICYLILTIISASCSRRTVVVDS